MMVADKNDGKNVLDIQVATVVVLFLVANPLSSFGSQHASRYLKTQ